MLWVGESHDSYEGVGPCGAAHALTRSRTAIAGTRSGSNPTSLGSGWATWTAWGRIASPLSRQYLYPMASRDDAEQLARRIIHHKLQRGYHIIIRATKADS